jgi:sporulation protein YlmC with PRC-barrel domain
MAAFAFLWPMAIRADDTKDKPKIEVQVGTAGPNRAPSTGESLPVYRLRHLVGMHVRDTAGKNIGKIEDLVIELHSGDVRYAALSVGGFAGIGNRLFAVPLSSLGFEHQAKDSHFVLDMTAEKFKNAPGFDKDQWPDFADRNWAAQIDTYYANVKVAKRPASEKPKTKEPAGAPSIYRATKVEGLAVKNDAHENLGKVNDIVVDMRHSQVRYAALEFGGFLGLGEKLFAIPWRAFVVRSDAKDKPHLELNVSQQRLKNAPGFDNKSWPDVGDPQWSSDIDRHYQDDLRETAAAKDKPVK